MWTPWRQWRQRLRDQRSRPHASERLQRQQPQLPAANPPPVTHSAEPGPEATVPAPPAAPAPPAPQIDASQIADLAQPVLDRLSEDESLRGDLTDAGFMPLLDWLSRLTTTAAGRIAATTRPDPAASMEQIGDAALQLGRALVQAAERGDTSRLAAALAPPLLAPDEVARVTVALPAQGSGATPDERMQALVTALSGAAPGTAGPA